MNSTLFMITAIALVVAVALDKHREHTRHKNRR